MLDPVELMFALKKLRARRAPANQAHVTNLKENPALLAADAAEAAARGFAELETTVGVSRYAPLNALAILVGAQTGRPGVMTQCAVEERLNLRLAIQGLVTYAETLSVYGTEPVFVDGDDTPWSKAFLASAYASRGVKVRFTSGGGSEALMGESEGKSMLYLEARCLAVVRAAGLAGRPERVDLVRRARALAAGRHARGARGERARGVARPRGRIRQRRDREPLGDPQDREADGAVPAGHGLRHVRLLVDAALRQHVRRRQLRLARLDEWLTIQRDWQVDAGIEPLAEDDAVAVRTRAARAVQAVFAELGFPPVTDEEVRLAATCLDSRDLPDRDRAADVLAGDRVLGEGISGLDVARALARRGFDDVAAAVFDMQRQRVAADYLQTAADHPAGRHGRLGGQRAERLPRPGNRLPAGGRALGAAAAVAVCDRRAAPRRGRGGAAAARGGRRCRAGERPDEVVIAVGPAFGGALGETINGLGHAEVLGGVVDGIREAGGAPRVVRVRRSADVAFIGHDGALLSGSGIAVGLQSKGTALIHRADLQPLDNLELFGMAPSLTLDSYRQIGSNAAGYALGRPVAPVPTVLDNYARAKLIVRTTLLHAREAAEVVRGARAGRGSTLRARLAAHGAA